MYRLVYPCGRGLREFPPLLRNGREFHLRFPDETACRDYLFTSVYPEGFRCSRCRGTHFVWLDSKHLRCTRVGCRLEASLTAGTILHRTRKPLLLWFKAAFLVVQSGTCARELMRLLSLATS